MIRRFYSWLFSAPPETATSWRIFVWWELRRIPYNLIVGGIGAVSLILFFFFVTHAHGIAPGEEAIEPMAIVAVPFVMNVCYTAGWMIEGILRLCHIVKTRELGLVLFKLGWAFSLFVVILPTTIWGIGYVIDVF
jgi:hypothetical protein